MERETMTNPDTERETGTQVPVETLEDAPEGKVSLISRRDFMTLLVGSGVTLVMAATLAEPLDTIVAQMLAEEPEFVEAQALGHKRHWGMVIDLSKCIGCDYCVYACQATNDTEDTMRWNIRIDDETETGEVFHVTRPCLHCRNAPCIDVCPVGATFHRDDGLVVMDYDKCIGCRYCQTACPYGARSFNWTERVDDPNPMAPEWGRPEVPRRPRGVIEKCTFCIHRIDAGLARGLVPGVNPEATPACVNICPVRARHFGDLNDPNSEVSRIIATTPTLRLREDLGTDPSVYYIPPKGMV
jgi:Fe-S-cluster-containing dehydrogenase component